MIVTMDAKVVLDTDKKSAVVKVSFDDVFGSTVTVPIGRSIPLNVLLERVACQLAELRKDLQ